MFSQRCGEHNGRRGGERHNGRGQQIGPRNGQNSPIFPQNQNGQQPRFPFSPPNQRVLG